MTLWILILLIPGSTWQMQENFSQTAMRRRLTPTSHSEQIPCRSIQNQMLQICHSSGLSSLRTVVLWRKRERLIIDSTIFLSCMFGAISDALLFEWITAPVCSDCGCFCLVSQILETVFSLTPFRWTCQMLHIALSADELYLSLFQFRWEPLPLCLHESQASLVSSVCYL